MAQVIMARVRRGLEWVVVLLGIAGLLVGLPVTVGVLTGSLCGGVVAGAVIWALVIVALVTEALGEIEA